jgi:flagellar protein FliS
MPIDHSAHRYQEMEIKTATPLELVVLLYDSGIASLQKAHEHIAAHDIAGRTKCLNRVCSILTELQSSLNFEAGGGEVARSLERLYNYMRNRVLHAHMRQDAAAVKEVIRLLTGLRSAWAEIARTEAQKAARRVKGAMPSEMPLAAGTSATSLPAGLNITA